jgi:hypothetical protein
LQIRQLDDLNDLSYSEADVLIFNKNPTSSGYSPTLSLSLPTEQAGIGELTMTLETALIGSRSALRYSAIGIYEYLSNKLDKDEPVAWVELVSPSNK